MPTAERLPATPDGSTATLIGRLRAWRGPRFWQELVLIGVSYFLYSLTRNVVPEHEALALRRAHDMLRVEHWFRLDIERSVNTAVSKLEWLAVACNYYYATMHFIVTIGVLLWLYRRHPLRYRPVRSVLYATTVTALLGFWLYALAPPRMLPGYTDTIVHFHTWGSWGSGDVQDVSNQFAAMPSLHIGWSLWCGLVIWNLARHRATRWAGLAYPAITLFVIVGTANHFLLDAVGGVAVLSIGFVVSRLLFGRPVFAPPPGEDTPAPASAPQS